MLQQVILQGFKGIEDIKIESLGRINVFIGKNNAGKTSILQALALSDDILQRPNMDNLGVNPSKYSFSRNPASFFEDKAFRFIGHFDNGTHVQIRANNEKNRQGDKFPTEGTIARGSQGELLKTIYIEPNLSVTYTGSNPSPRTIIGYFREGSHNNYNAAQLLFALNQASDQIELGFSKKDYQTLIDTIKQYFPEIKHLSSHVNMDGENVFHYEEDGYDKSLDIQHIGTGVKSFLDILIKVIASQAKTILIDEPERGLHPEQQRNFMQFIIDFATRGNKQVFITTHSPVILNYSDEINLYRVFRENGRRMVSQITKESIHTVYGDLGMRPSDLFNSDICLMVEGQTEVILFEHIIRELYKDDFKSCSVSVQQYGGGAAEGITNGSISIGNITTVQQYTYWIHDRDAAAGQNPPTNVQQFINKLESQGAKATTIWKKREIEYYLPLALHIDAQQGNAEKQVKIKEIYDGEQKLSFKEQARPHELCVANGAYLKRLLKNHLQTKEQLEPELTEVINTLLAWRKEILSEEISPTPSLA